MREGADNPSGCPFVSTMTARNAGAFSPLAPISCFLELSLQPATPMEAIERPERRWQFVSETSLDQGTRLV
jgi:hypothetical protein